MSETRTEWNKESAHQRVKRAALAADLNERYAWLNGWHHSDRFGDLGKLPEWVRLAALHKVSLDTYAVQGFESKDGRMISEPKATAEDVEALAAEYGVGDKLTAASALKNRVKEWNKRQEKAMGDLFAR